MPSTKEIIYLLFHPAELRSIIQWTVWHDAPHQENIDPKQFTPELTRCFYFLDKTSRSFAAVIKELHPDLLVPICLFYLVLRGLDTIEDDMTIPLADKIPELLDFHNKLDQDGWTYDGNHVKEKDRDLLLEFNVVIAEFKKIKESFRVIIKDITRRMGAGMAESVQRTEKDVNWCITVEDYEKYCHYAAGLVGEGLTRLFVDSGLANPRLLENPELHESMGQFLQQTNVIRDIKEDLDDKRRFWPKDVWSKYVDKFEDLCDPAHREAALACQSEMILIALSKVPDCLHYLAGLREQSVFNFAAIPQGMAIATLELCFRNGAMLERNIKITKGQACRTMIDSSQNLEVLCGFFRTYCKKMHKKNNPKDPNFLQISIACGRIEQFIESIFPSQKPPEPKKLEADAPRPQLSEEAVLAEAEAKRVAEENKWDMIYMGVAVGGTIFVITLFMFFIAWMAGARFDLAFKSLLSLGERDGPNSVFEEAARATRKAKDEL